MLPQLRKYSCVPRRGRNLLKPYNRYLIFESRMPIPGPAGHRERRLSYRRISCPDCFIEEDLEMRTNFDFTPYRRSTVGFDRLFDLLENEPRGDVRSEEHTSELQSLMRNSYAVLLL